MGAKGSKASHGDKNGFSEIQVETVISTKTILDDIEEYVMQGAIPGINNRQYRDIFSLLRRGWKKIGTRDDDNVLDLGGFALGDTNVKQLFTGLNTLLQALKSSDYARENPAVISSISKLARLSLSENGLTAKSISAICSVIANDAWSIQSIDLSRNHFTDEIGRALFDAISTNTSLRSLDMSSNQLGFRSFACIANMLPKTSTIRSLILDRNFCNESGAALVADSLQKNVSLIHLTMDWERFPFILNQKATLSLNRNKVVCQIIETVFLKVTEDKTEPQRHVPIISKSSPGVKRNEEKTTFRTRAKIDPSVLIIPPPSTKKSSRQSPPKSASAAMQSFQIATTHIVTQTKRREDSLGVDSSTDSSGSKGSRLDSRDETTSVFSGRSSFISSPDSYFSFTSWSDNLISKSDSNVSAQTKSSPSKPFAPANQPNAIEAAIQRKTHQRNHSGTSLSESSSHKPSSKTPYSLVISSYGVHSEGYSSTSSPSETASTTSRPSVSAESTTPVNLKLSKSGSQLISFQSQKEEQTVFSKPAPKPPANSPGGHLSSTRSPKQTQLASPFPSSPKTGSLYTNPQLDKASVKNGMNLDTPPTDRNQKHLEVKASNSAQTSSAIDSHGVVPLSKPKADIKEFPSPTLSESLSICFSETSITTTKESPSKSGTASPFERSPSQKLLNSPFSSGSTKPNIPKFGSQKVIRECQRFRVGVADRQGRRPTMEDCVVIHGRFRDLEDEDYFGVFDGHGGWDAAAYVAYNLHHALAQAMKSTSDVGSALTKGFETLNAEMSGWALNSGTTAAVVFIKGSVIYSANAGDTRVVHCKNGVVKRLSVDHKPTVPEEQRRILDLGGTVRDHRVSGILAVSRSFGDSRLAPYVTANPYVTSKRIDTIDPAREVWFIPLCLCMNGWIVVSKAREQF
eukprot:TRINITY_DN8348_c0_g5_i2.p1 TRINITY_DN8348_c0_g5~~TRINITY_DN8348_c0_g5_i2.p1  ORF type:complete len:914 (-),score=158.65 TRINITY_DN8348_c0_g5_i2:315-3056(-)